MFWFKRSKIHVDCFTTNVHAFELFPIDNSLEFIPEWWTHAPKEYKVRDLFPSSTIKRCPAIINQYKYGIIIPLWSDLAVSSKGGTNWEIKFSDPKTNMEQHDAGQWSAYADPTKFTHIKLKSPWALKTKDEIYWTYSKPVWNFPAGDKLIVAPGVLEFKHQHSTHVNLFIPTSDAFSQVFTAGQPISQMIPLSDKEVVVHRHLIDEAEYDRQFENRFNHSFTRGYTRTKKIKKAKKCPFHF